MQFVLSNKADAYGLARAKNTASLPQCWITNRLPSREDYDQAVVDVLRARGVELVILAGFMRLLSPVFIKAYSNRIMNIHPALLPSFPVCMCRKKHVDHGVRFSGCTVHFVNEECDEGPIIIQAVVPVFPDDDEATLAARILKQEHRIYPRAIQLYAEGQLHVTGRKVLVDGLTQDESPVLSTAARSMKRAKPIIIFCVKLLVSGGLLAVFPFAHSSRTFCSYVCDGGLFLHRIGAGGLSLLPSDQRSALVHTGSAVGYRDAV